MSGQMDRDSLRESFWGARVRPCVINTWPVKPSVTPSTNYFLVNTHIQADRPHFSETRS